MKKLTLVFSILVLAISSCGEAGLDTKLIASEYYQGVVKILLLDSELEKTGKGKGYMGRGSGFLVTEDGYLFTNKHVIEICVKGYIQYSYKDSNNKIQTALSTYSDEVANSKDLVSVYRTGFADPYVQVFYGSGENDFKLYKAEVVSVGEGAYDGAMLKIIGDAEGNPIRKKFKPVPLDNADEIAQGEQLCVYGFPAQYEGTSEMMMRDLSTLSIGIMSGYDYVMNPDYGYIKTDAEIHKGNSGGPVFNEKNKVIGIATAKGHKTGIGLVGGINGMYFISALDNHAHKQLVESGLTFPKRASSINTIPGVRQEIKSAKDLNSLIAKRTIKKSTYSSPKTKTSYTWASMYFSNVNRDQNGGKFPTKEERYDRFRINPSAGENVIHMYVSSGLTPFRTKTFKVYVDKLSSTGKYVVYKSFYVDNIPSTKYLTYFSYKFQDIGTYKVSIYSNENKYITSKKITLVRK
ncbi:trypsin-like peptidase domain-containing protein [Flavobacteriaceae bacterium TK19130]|nr:trypsin-like peptidase domain-containing protein [Thermobacterium salinum]